MDMLGTFLFIIISLFFAGLISLIIKWTLGRISTTINSTPYSVLVLFIFFLLIFLQWAGVDVAGAYKAFFKWLSTAFYISTFSILHQTLQLIPVDRIWLSMSQVIFIYFIGLVTGIILTYALLRKRRRRR